MRRGGDKNGETGGKGADNTRRTSVADTGGYDGDWMRLVDLPLLVSESVGNHELLMAQAPPRPRQ